ncbi:hypothetical protein SUGI_0841950 [Cryptomeria japonica]|nr:hypothetical protein SUGI_0841950 [Cryptomeria japonica]
MSMRAGKAKAVAKKKNLPGKSSSSYNGYGRSEEGDKGSTDGDGGYFDCIGNTLAKDSVHIKGSSTLAICEDEIGGSEVMVSYFQTSKGMDFLYNNISYKKL